MAQRSADDFLEIDMLRLDQEWREQPNLFYQYATRLANAKRDLDEIKSEIDVKKAELYLEIAKNPEAHGIIKTTEASINAAIVTDSSLKALLTEEIDAKHAIGVFDAAVKAIDQRKKALEDIVKLHLADYYSAPRACENDSSETTPRTRAGRKPRKEKD